MGKKKRIVENLLQTHRTGLSNIGLPGTYSQYLSRCARQGAKVLFEQCIGGKEPASWCQKKTTCHSVADEPAYRGGVKLAEGYVPCNWWGTTAFGGRQDGVLS